MKYSPIRPALFFAFLSCLFLLGTTALKANTKNYTLSYRDDPSTTIVVGWSGDDATVYFDVVDHGTQHLQYAQNRPSDRSVSHKGQNRRYARLSGLQPKTVYYFVIYDVNGQASQRFKFQTLSDNPSDPVNFISGGDSRQSVEVFGIPVEDCPTAAGCRGERQKGNQLVALIRPDFVAFNGDFVRNTLGIGVNQEWEDWLQDWQLSIAADGRMSPFVLTQGNHEDNNDMNLFFDIPQEEYYTIDIHNGLLRLYSLNSELNACSNANMQNWLVTDLQNHTGTANDPIWKAAQYHIPVFSQGNGYGIVQEQMDCWVDKFEQYNVDLVMESHAHITKWTWPMLANANRSDFVRADSTGIVYIGEGQWGAPHRTLDFTGANQKPYVRDQDVFDSFFFLRVTTDTISIQNVRFENLQAITAMTDDDLGSGLPPGVSLWTPSNGNTLYITHISSTVGIEPADFRVKRIYPMPAQHQVNIEFDRTMSGATIEVYNGLGKFCKSANFSGQSYQLDVTDVCNGVNFIYIKTADGVVERHKLVKID